MFDPSKVQGVLAEPTAESQLDATGDSQKQQQGERHNLKNALDHAVL